jgi:hypothetical protein
VSEDLCVLIASLGHTLRTGQKRHAKHPSQLKELSLLTMKTHFVLSVLCAVMSLFAILGLSAMTVIPGSDAERYRDPMMLVVGVCFTGWLCLASWLRARSRTAFQAPLPRWLSRFLMGVSVVYLIFVLLFAIG